MQTASFFFSFLFTFIFSLSFSHSFVCFIYSKTEQTIDVRVIEISKSLKYCNLFVYFNFGRSLHAFILLKLFFLFLQYCESSHVLRFQQFIDFAYVFWELILSQTQHQWMIDINTFLLSLLILFRIYAFQKDRDTGTGLTTYK